MKSRFFLTLFSICSYSLLSAFEEAPWFHDLWEFHLTPSYLYRYYPSVADSTGDKKYSSNDQFINTSLTVTVLPALEAAIDLEFAKTHRQCLGVQSTAIQMRYLFLDDVAGDPVSLSSGIMIRYVSPRSLKDVSCPYAGSWNYELVTALGKEMDKLFDWTWRGYGTLTLGQANQGNPYLKNYLAVEVNQNDRHHWKLFLDSYFGFGNKHKVNVAHFDGYGSIYHQSIDLGLGYAYHLQIWGEIGLDAAYRVFAKAYPENAVSVLFYYQIPFSFF